MVDKYKDKGFSLIELAVAVALMTIVLPAATLMLTSIMDTYRTMSVQNNLTQKSDFVLKTFSREVKELTTFTDIWTAPENVMDDLDNAFMFRNSSGKDVGFKIVERIEGEEVLYQKIQYCQEECENRNNWYDLVNESDLVPSPLEGENKITYFLDDLQPFERHGDYFADIRYIGLTLVFKTPAGELLYHTLISTCVPCL